MTATGAVAGGHRLVIEVSGAGFTFFVSLHV